MPGEIPSVFELIKLRAQSGSKPGERDDPFRLAWVPQGGVHRGVVTGGEANFLDVSGFVNTLDEIHATSSGAWAGAFLAARQTAIGTSIYYDELSSTYGEFISRRGFLAGGPLVKMDYLMWVTRNRKILDTKKVIESPIPLHIYLTSVKDGSLVDAYPFSNQEAVLNALKLTAKLPVVADNKGIKAGSLEYIDGSVAAGGLPFRQAVENGCTHALVSPSVSRGEIVNRLSVSERLVFKKIARDGYPHLRDVYKLSLEECQRVLGFCKDGQGFYTGCQINAIWVDAKSLPDRLDVHPWRLYQGAKAGFDAARHKFSGIPYDIDWTKYLQPPNILKT